jgi:hypothetical protein
MPGHEKIGCTGIHWCNGDYNASAKSGSSGARDTQLNVVD